MTLQIMTGDCIELMRTLPDNSVDSIVTSPPYAEQRKATYGGIPEADYPEWTVTWMRQAKRVLKTDGSVLINISPHVRRGQLSDYVLRTRLALREDGWNEVDELIWHKTNAMPVGHKDRPRRSWESILWFSKHGGAYSNAKANGIKSRYPTKVTQTGQHTYQDGWGHLAGGSGQSGGSGKTPETTRCSNLVSLSKVVERTGHPAPFPLELARWMARIVTPPGGVVLDPFAGSGTTVEAALMDGFSAVAMEREETYLPLIQARIDRYLATQMEDLI